MNKHVLGFLGKAAVGALAACVFCLASFAQTPTQSTINFAIGAGAFGLAATSSATPGSDITVQLNPGFKNAYFSQVSLLSDNMLASNIQYFGGGLTGPIPDPFPTSSAFGKLYFYWRASAGADRITSTATPSVTTSAFAFLAGGGVGYIGPSGLRVQLVEVDAAHFPGAPFGNTAPAVSGSISWIFGHNTTNPAVARELKAEKQANHNWNHGPWPR